MKNKVLLGIAYYPLGVFAALFALQFMPFERTVEESVGFKPFVIFASLSSIAVIVAAFVHLYRYNDDVHGFARFRWSLALLFVSIFAIPEYTRRFVLPHPA